MNDARLQPAGDPLAISHAFGIPARACGRLAVPRVFGRAVRPGA